MLSSVMVATYRCRRRDGRVISRESGYSSPTQTEAYISGNKLMVRQSHLHDTTRHDHNAKLKQKQITRA